MTVDTKQYPGFANLSAMGSDANVIKFLMKSAMTRLNTSLPVEVLAVKAAGVDPVGFVDVRILVDQITADDKTHQYGMIPNVPYFRLQGGDKAVIIDPEVGDIGMACFCSRDISAMKNARKGAPPGSRRMYDISDALYVGGFLNKAPTHYIQFTNDGILVHTPGAVTVEAATAMIKATTSATVNAPSVSIGQGGATLRSMIDERFVAAFNSHTHPSNGAAPSTSVITASVATSATKAN